MDRRKLIDERNLFYRNGFRNLLLFCFVMLLINAGLLALIFYQHIARPKPQYFVTTSQGRLVEIKPSGQ